MNQLNTHFFLLLLLFPAAWIEAAPYQALLSDNYNYNETGRQTLPSDETLSTLSGGLRDDEDDFEPGAGNDNDSSYVDNSIIGSGLFFIMMLGIVYIFFLKPPTDNKNDKKNIIIMKRKISRNVALCALFCLFYAGQVNAQVTIGSNGEPNADALLDLKQNADGSSEKGLLYPRVALKSTHKSYPLKNHVQGMTVYNTATDNDVTPGIYINDGSKWIRVNNPGWFYLPSIPIDVTTDQTNATIDLYTEYVQQFNREQTLIKSDENAPVPFTAIYEAEDYYYYIIGYDETVFSNLSISNTGEMTYSVDADNVTDATYINIVLMVK